MPPAVLCVAAVVRVGREKVWEHEMTYELADDMLRLYKLLGERVEWEEDGDTYFLRLLDDKGLVWETGCQGEGHDKPMFFFASVYEALQLMLAAALERLRGKWDIVRIEFEDEEIPSERVVIGLEMRKGTQIEYTGPTLLAAHIAAAEGEGT